MGKGPHHPWHIYTNKRVIWPSTLMPNLLRTFLSVCISKSSLPFSIAHCIPEHDLGKWSLNSLLGVVRRKQPVSNHKIEFGQWNVISSWVETFISLELVLAEPTPSDWTPVCSPGCPATPYSVLPSRLSPTGRDVFASPDPHRGFLAGQGPITCALKMRTPDRKNVYPPKWWIT